LVALADFASDDTRECWPSMRTLARRSRVERRSAQRILRRLEQRGLIEIATGGHQYGANAASCYRLRFTYDGERLETTEPKLSPRATQGRGGATLTTRKGDPGDTQGRPRVAPSVIDPSLNQRALVKKLKPEKPPQKSRLEQLEGLRKKQEGKGDREGDR
jgi:hypothetical protein